jgi:putative SOS response-associated peptidase YedK
MCGRFAIIEPARLAALFGLESGLDFPPRYNIAPTQPVPVVHEDHGRRTMALMRWGFVPGWVKDPREFPLLINARSETMAEKPAFRDALRHGRCIVPADGYFEWRTGPDKRKQPFYVSRTDGKPMAMAGLCSIWCGPNGEEVDTVAIVTVPANAELAPIHDRMPAILDPAGFDDWLDTGGVSAAAASRLALPQPVGALRYHPVSTRVNAASQDDPGLVLAAAETLPAPARNRQKPKSDAGGQLDLF